MPIRIVNHRFMSILTIAIYPAPILHTKAAPVEKVDDDVRRLLDDLTETMYAAPGVGLAAPQVSISRRITVMDVEDGRALYQMVNPEIVSQSGAIEWEEGCLSIPEFRIVMKRSQNVVCRYLDRHGKKCEVAALDLFAVCIQHEIDHLNGKLIIDEVSTLKQDLYLQKLKKGKR